MTRARRNLIDRSSTPYYHCMARCVRRAFLCGKDSFSGQDYEHRRQWVVDRLDALVSVFAIEVCAYAVMSNHYHVVLHINTAAAESWNRDDIFARWTQLFTGPVLVQRYLAGIKLDQGELLRVDEYAEEYRSRLMDISWFMRCLNEHLAREANKEDRCKGRFWEGRFKSQALLDEAALLTCMAYVDLNPIRAKLAKTPESSDFTSIRCRIESRIECRIKQYTATTGNKQSAQLKPLRAQGQNPDIAIPFTLVNYLELIDWAGREIRPDKRGHIRHDAPPILERLGIDSDEWLKTIGWNNQFRRAVGRLASMRAYAEQVGQQWMQGLTACCRVFSG